MHSKSKLPKFSQELIYINYHFWVLQSDFAKSFRRHRSLKFEHPSAKVILVLWNVNKTTPNLTLFGGGVFWQGGGKEWGWVQDNKKWYFTEDKFYESVSPRFWNLTIAITSTFPYEIEGKKALPAHDNAIKEQYERSSVRTVLSHRTPGQEKLKRTAVNNNLFTP